MPRPLFSLLSAAALALGLGVAQAQAGNQLAVAVGGYDAVSYHAGAPEPGAARFNHFWNGAVWYFATEANRDAFRAEPARYAPAFDGYCSWAASQGYKAPGDPTVYAIVDGQLYLQVHARAKEMWDADRQGFIAKGGENWPRIHPF